MNKLQNKETQRHIPKRTDVLRDNTRLTKKKLQGDNINFFLRAGCTCLMYRPTSYNKTLDFYVRLNSLKTQLISDFY